MLLSTVVKGVLVSKNEGEMDVSFVSLEGKAKIISCRSCSYIGYVCVQLCVHLNKNT